MSVSHDSRLLAAREVTVRTLEGFVREVLFANVTQNRALQQTRQIAINALVHVGWSLYATVTKD